MSLIGLKDLMESMGIGFEDKTSRQKVVAFLNRNRVPFIGIGRERAGYVRGVLVDGEGLAAEMQRRLAAKAQRAAQKLLAKETGGQKAKGRRPRRKADQGTSD